MNLRQISQCRELMNKLESNSLFLYFTESSKFADANMDGQFFQSINSKLIQNSYKNFKIFKEEFVKFFTTLMETQDITKIEKKSIKYLKKKVLSEVNSIEPITPEQWIEKWSAKYLTLIEKISNLESLDPSIVESMKKLNNPASTDKMELFAMKNQILKNLDEKQLAVVDNLLRTLENPTEESSSDSFIDLLTIKSDTFYALKTYLSRVQSNSEDNIFKKSNSHKRKRYA